MIQSVYLSGENDNATGDLWLFVRNTKSTTENWFLISSLGGGYHKDKSGSLINISLSVFGIINKYRLKEVFLTTFKNLSSKRTVVLITKVYRHIPILCSSVQVYGRCDILCYANLFKRGSKYTSFYKLYLALFESFSKKKAFALKLYNLLSKMVAPPLICWYLCIWF